MPAAKTRSIPSTSASPEKALVNLAHYVPAYLTWIANKLSGGASQHYLNAFGVGIETWRCLVLLAAEPTVSAQQISRVIGMDKGSVSRCFKTMHEQKLITLSLSDTDGRIRLASLTARGRKLHDQILGVALERERVLLSTLSTKEQDQLIDLLARLHDNLPDVEAATHAYLQEKFPRLLKAAAHRKVTTGG